GKTAKTGNGGRQTLLPASVRSTGAGKYCCRPPCKISTALIIRTSRKVAMSTKTSPAATGLTGPEAVCKNTLNLLIFLVLIFMEGLPHANTSHCATDYRLYIFNCSGIATVREKRRPLRCNQWRCRAISRAGNSASHVSCASQGDSHPVSFVLYDHAAADIFRLMNPPPSDRGFLFYKWVI